MFVILIVGAIVAGGALLLEVNVQPALLGACRHLAAGDRAILTFAFLRLMKALLLVLQYKHQAREGRRCRLLMYFAACFRV